MYFNFQDTKLTMIGRRVPKTWTVPAPIRYVKVTTLYMEEVLLLGLLNGQVTLILVFSIKLDGTYNNFLHPEVAISPDGNRFLLCLFLRDSSG